MGPDQRLSQHQITSFNRIDHTAARLRLDIDTDCTERQLALKRAR